MATFNHPDFFTSRPIGLENKLILPTARLYEQASVQLNALYQDIRSALLDAHSIVATAAKQIYGGPVETLAAWYDAGTVLYAQTEAAVIPVYQNWQVNMASDKEKAAQYLRAFWDNPGQVATATFEPVTRYAKTVTEQSGHYWQAFIDNPEQFMAATFAPVNHYLASLSEEAEAALISSYYGLTELLSFLVAQPTATIQAVYRNTLSALLDVYFEIISPLLVLA